MHIVTCVHAEFQHLRAVALLSPGATPQVCPVDTLHLTGLTMVAFRALKKDHSSARGAAKAYRESQSRIYKLEATMYVGVGEGTDSLDFHADLSTLKAILPDETTDRSSSSRPVPRSESPLLQKLKQGETTYAYCAWCPAALPTRHKLEEHYFAAHQVVLQPSCCAPPSVFQTIMGKELQLRQGNFASFLITKLSLSPQMDFDEAREILGAMCSVTEDKPEFGMSRCQIADKQHCVCLI